MSSYKKIDASDFTARPCGFGQWKLEYESPVTHRKWRCHYTDAETIDALNGRELSKRALHALKRTVKQLAEEQAAYYRKF